MNKLLKTCGTALIFAAGLATSALANDRYANPPPVMVSPDLSAPWLMQLQNHPIGEQTRPTPERTAYVARREKPRARKRAIDPIYLPQNVRYKTKHRAGTIVIDTDNRFLYLVRKNGKARRYGVGVGKPGFEWSGTHKVTRKAQWPTWRPPVEMIERERAKGRELPNFMEGGPRNPLGARALYLGSTLYRIHGTNQPWTIGQAVSSGCIRMRNEDVSDLYERVKVGSRVIVQ